MAWIEWIPEYSVNIRRIDDQHKKFIAIINELYEALSGESQTKEIVNRVIGELADYTRYHFGSEEELMRDNRYPDYLSHKTKHDNFTAKVSEFQDGYRKGYILVLSVEIIRFLRDWLINHILSVDKQYSPFLNQQGVY